MAAELPAIVVHFILEIDRGISDEGENVETRGILTHNSVCCIHPSLSILDLSRQFFLRKHKQKCKSVLVHWYGLFISCASNHKTQNLTVLVIIFIKLGLIKGEKRFWGWLFQKVCAGFTCMALYLSKGWSHNLARIGVYLTTYLWYTGTVTTNRSLYMMPRKSSKRQQMWHCAKPKEKQRLYYWGHQQLICMMSWGAKSNRKRKWKVGICTCSNFSWPN